MNLFTFEVAMAVCGLVLLHQIITRLKKSKGLFPPGPRCVPFLGNLQLLKSGPLHLKMARWAVQYGKMYTLYITGRPILVLNDANLMKNLLGRTAATGRSPTAMATMLFWLGRYGILLTSGRNWSEQKHFYVKAFINIGLGHENRLEQLGLAEANKLCEWMGRENVRGQENKLFLHRVLVQCTSNFMWAILTGQTTEQLEAPRIFQLIQQWFTYLPSMDTQGKMSLLKLFAPMPMEVKEICQEIRGYIELQFKEHRESRVEGEPLRDVIDAYVEKVENCQDAASTFYGEKGWKNSYSSALMSIVAGAESTGVTITWTLYYLSVHGEVQERLQREIDSVLGRDRAPTLEDRKDMHYTEAVILEALRFSTLLPLGGTLTLLEDFVLDGYLLPRGTPILSNLYFANNDKTVWGDPENFRPERFLDEENEHLRDMMVSFQMGKRACPGSHFAKDIIFLFVAKLFQTFTFSVDPDVQNLKEYFEPIPAFLWKPKELALVVRNRNR